MCSLSWIVPELMTYATGIKHLFRNSREPRIDRAVVSVKADPPTAVQIRQTPTQKNRPNQRVDREGSGGVSDLNLTMEPAEPWGRATTGHRIHGVRSEPVADTRVPRWEIGTCRRSRPASNHVPNASAAIFGTTVFDTAFLRSNTGRDGSNSRRNRDNSRTPDTSRPHSPVPDTLASTHTDAPPNGLMELNQPPDTAARWTSILPRLPPTSRSSTLRQRQAAGWLQSARSSPFIKTASCGFPSVRRMKRSWHFIYRPPLAAGANLFGTDTTVRENLRSGNLNPSAWPDTSPGCSGFSRGTMRNKSTRRGLEYAL